MEKSEFIVMSILVITFMVIAIGCFGAFFYDWKWHNIALGVGALEMAIVFGQAVLSEYRETQNTIKVQK